MIYKVLVVDDEPAVLEVLEEIIKNVFKKKGLEANVETANGLASALGSFIVNEHDLVFSDLMMSGPDDGFKLLQEVKSVNPKTFFTLSSGSFLPGDIERFKLFGANQVLPKPITVTDITETIGLFSDQ